MQKLKPEEKDFMDALYRKEYNRLYKYAKMNMPETFAVEDIVQDTFGMACSKIKILMKHDRPDRWLLETLKYNINNFRRTRQTLTKHFVDIPIDEWFEKYPAVKMQEDDLDFLYGDLAKYKEYDILKKYVVEGLSIQMIASEYGITPNTCRQRIFRAKKVLQQVCLNEKKSKKFFKFM